MSHHVHKVKAFMLSLEDRPGAGAQVTADLKNHGLSLRAFWGWAEEGGIAKVIFIPEDPDQVASCGCDTCCAAKPMSVLWLEDVDKPGALDENLQAIAVAAINLEAALALGTGGRYAGVLVFKQEEDLDKALAALGECCA